jgi:hypothetical protein
VEARSGHGRRGRAIEMPRALDIVREVALLENYALPLERADALPKARDITTPLRLAHLLAHVMHGRRIIDWESGKCRGSFQISVAGIPRQESRQALGR